MTSPKTIGANAQIINKIQTIIFSDKSNLLKSQIIKTKRYRIVIIARAKIEATEKNIFAEKSTIKGLKIKKETTVKDKDKDKVINQMRQKIKEDKERSREE